MKPLRRRLLDVADFADLLRAKCVVRNVEYKDYDDFFPPAMLDYVEKTWEQWLGPLVPGLPRFDIVIDELRPQVTTLLDDTGVNE